MTNCEALEQAAAALEHTVRKLPEHTSHPYKDSKHTSQQQGSLTQ